MMLSFTDQQCRPCFLGVRVAMHMVTNNRFVADCWAGAGSGMPARGKYMCSRAHLLGRVLPYHTHIHVWKKEEMYLLYFVSVGTCLRCRGGLCN